MSVDQGQEAASGTNFGEKAERPLAATIVLALLVSVATAGFAHYFKYTAQLVLQWYAGTASPTEAAVAVGWEWRLVIAAVTVLIGATIGLAVESRWGRNTGVEAIAATARGEGRRISLPATAARGLATWTTSAGLVSIGRETAIIEAGGAMGSLVGRRTRGVGNILGTAGIAAAFAAAYHAPLAAVFYVEEHLRIRDSRTASVFAVVGAGTGFASSIYLFDGGPIFPPTRGSAWQMLEFGLIGVLPAVVAARLFLETRTRVGGGRLAARLHMPSWMGVGVLVLVAAVMIALYPMAAGNGMEALRGAGGALGVSWGLAITLSLAKFVGTTAALGSGAPGGTLTPTISIASGAALLAILASAHFGLIAASPWDAMLVTMAVGVAVGLRSPLVGVVLIPEMVGEYWMIPIMAVVVAVAVVFDHGIDVAVRAGGNLLPIGVYDDDA